ncbi:M28 family peptidase [Chloroflexota bacterium]
MLSDPSNSTPGHSPGTTPEIQPVSRRDFLKAAGIIAAGSFLASCNLPTPAEPINNPGVNVLWDEIKKAYIKSLVTISKWKIRSHIKKLEGVRHWRENPQALEAAADYISDTLERYGHTVTRQPFTEEGRVFENILGLQEGIEEPDKFILITAHFDTVAGSPGANDNASGVAAMLELARVLGKQTFKKSIVYVGMNREEWKEEVAGSSGKKGSTAMAGQARMENKDIVGVINFDEIGYAGDDYPQEWIPGYPASPGKGNFIGVVGNEKSAGLVLGYQSVIEAFHISLPVVLMVVPENGEQYPDTRRSDHAPFWDMGYPGIMLTDTANYRFPHGHKPSDTFDKLNLDFIVKVCRAAGLLVFQAAEWKFE